MISDATTFFLGFIAVFLGFGIYMWRIDRQASRLEQRIEALEADDEGDRPRRRDR